MERVVAREASREPQPPVELDRVQVDDGHFAAIVMLNRPEQMNPLDWQTIGQLETALAEAEADSAVSAVLISGRGRAFSAGGDLKSYVELQEDPVAFPAFLADLHRTFQGISKMTKPVVALVNGTAAAGGLELILSCDIAIAAASARIGDGHLTYGQMGGGGVLTLLPRSVGPARARELIFSGRWLTAEEAREWGIISRVVPDGELLAAGLEFASVAATRSPLALANAKFVLNAIWADSMSIEAGLRLERERNAYYCLTSEDAREGLRAFQEKRKPRFKGK
jgi:enoyl-CoA hydratase/carnithine racemase